MTATLKVNLKEVRVLDFLNLNLKGAAAELLDAIPAAQRHSAETALRRLETVGNKDSVITEWHAGKELSATGALRRFSPAAAFFFLFKRACSGRFEPVWTTWLTSNIQSSAAAAAAAEAKKKQQCVEEAAAAQRAAGMQVAADRLLADLGPEGVLEEVAKRGWQVPSSPEIAALILAGEEPANTTITNQQELHHEN